MTKIFEFNKFIKLNEDSSLWYVCDIIGRRRHGKEALFWCECGRYKKVYVSNVLKGKSKTCGLRSRHRAEGVVYRKDYPLTHSSWVNMNYRCNNENATNYEYYGGRGILVCDRWSMNNPEGFENFLNDMGERKSKNMTIDRINTNDNYAPHNCKWSSKSDQAYNQNRMSNNRSGVTGVNYYAQYGKWVAYIAKDGKTTWLGYHDTFEDAVEARRDGEIQIYGAYKEDIR